jgi:hypothetical protein
LNETSQGRIALRLHDGERVPLVRRRRRPRSSGNPPSTASNDKVDKFVGARRTPARQRPAAELPQRA